MSDAFEVLRSPLSPVTPDPEFAQRLRARIARALSLPKGVTVSDLDLDLTATDDRDAPPQEATRGIQTDRPSDFRATITPYLALSGAAEAIEWYQAAFGARLRSDPILMGDGRVGHAEIEIGGALVMLADEFPDIGHTAPTSDLGVHVSLHLSVDDVDEMIDRAVVAGADLERPASDSEYGRNGAVRDPFGHRWLIFAEHAAEPSPDRDSSVALRHGDIGYASLWLPDAERGASFYSRVLGWTYEPATTGSRARQVRGLARPQGLWGPIQRATLFCCFAVDDLQAAVERVRSAGGTAGEPQSEPYGMISECTDDQGVRFALFSPPGGVRASGSPARPDGGTDSGNGDLAYITMEVPDSSRTRSFYGKVLGWRFLPGRVEDGWQVEDVAPMVGLSGGHESATTVPMFQVDDIESAVQQVRSAGGTASPPEVQPYGITSTCTDDQETRFYLGQL